MDPLTHSALGVTCGLLVAKPEHRRAAALAGLAGGLLPDADIFLKSAEDPLFTLEYHRHFTHSFAFSPVMMLLAVGIAGLLMRIFRKQPPWRYLFLPAILAIWSHTFCDLWTSYGTRAFWPFTQARSALDWVSVIDPILTLPLIIFTIWAVGKRSRFLAGVGAAWVTLYLCLAVFQQHRATNALEEIMRATNAKIDRSTVKPSFGNIILWRGIYEANGAYHTVAIHCGLSGVKTRIGSSAEKVTPPALGQAWQNLPATSIQLNDVARFAHFSDHWLAWHPTEPAVLGDMRYAQLPHEISPLWGILLDVNEPDRHVQFVTRRINDKSIWTNLWEMICGNPRWFPA